MHTVSRQEKVKTDRVKETERERLKEKDEVPYLSGLGRGYGLRSDVSFGGPHRTTSTVFRLRSDAAVFQQGGGGR